MMVYLIYLDASKLDTFVFDHFEKLIQSSKQNKTLFNLLHSEKIVFFLHLLGLDTNGHAHKPYSKEYLDNISLVDKGLEKVAVVIDDFYRDNSTSFVFASDHGMSNRGNHGDGHPTNTETPLIAWGAGIKKSSSGISKYGLLNMNDVNQADVAPLMVFLFHEVKFNWDPISNEL
jgi:phosphatidylinositol glycan class N